MESNSITKKLLFNTVRVDTVLEDGSEGSGTAFLVSHAHPRGTHTFIVTNRHLVDGVRRGGLVFTQKRNGQPALWVSSSTSRTSPSACCAPGPGGGPRDRSDAPTGAGGARSGYRALLSRHRQPLVPDTPRCARLDALEEVPVRWLPERGLGPGQSDAHPAPRYDGYPDGVDSRVGPRVSHRRRGLPGLERQPVFLYQADVLRPTQSVGRKFLFAGVVAAVFFRRRPTTSCRCRVREQQRHGHGLGDDRPGAGHQVAGGGGFDQRLPR